jgi:hypothetical protein
MGILAVLAAAAAAWGLGAVWYMALAAPWMAASGVPRDAAGQPANAASPLPFVLSALCLVLVAGMMRHIFATSGIATPGAGLVSGLGVGAFLIAPWIAINNLYAMRPYRLTLIDGGYAVAGCAVMGLVLTLV